MARVGVAYVPIHADLDPLRREVKSAFKDTGGLSKQINKLGKDSNKSFSTATKNVDNYSRSVDRASGKSKLLGSNLFKLNAQMTFLGRAIKFLKWPALIS